MHYICYSLDAKAKRQNLRVFQHVNLGVLNALSSALAHANFAKCSLSYIDLRAGAGVGNEKLDFDYSEGD